MKRLQKMGKSLMIPITCLPVCGIIMGIGYLLCPAGMQGGDIVGIVARIGYFLCKAGSAVIDHIPILFAVSIGIGMSETEGGGIAALVSWLMIVTLLKIEVISVIFPEIVRHEAAALSFSKIENPFIGIIAGLIGAFCVAKFSSKRLPQWLSFFSGKRLGIIMSGLVSIAVSAVLAVAWPMFFTLLTFLGEKIVGLGALGSAIYATLNRLLIPFGIHHALNNVFWFDTIGLGDLTTFWAGKTSADVSWSLGMYMSGFFPSMMFGIPAAALAMRRSFKGRNKQASGLLLSSALSAFLCGVTEPFEFSFLFVSPALYVVYSILYGVFTYITLTAGFRAGFSFSAGLTDLIFSASLPAAQKTLLIIPLGIAAFVVYYIVFRLLITKFDLKTPGREPQPDDAPVSGTAVPTPFGMSGDTARAAKIISGLGGGANIVSVSNCATRLRLELRDTSLCNDAAIKSAGAAGVIRMKDGTVQVVIGLDVEFVAAEVKRQLQNSALPESETPKASASETADVFSSAEPEMILIGRTANAGIAIGRIHLTEKPPLPEKKAIHSVQSERNRFDGALNEVKKNLKDSCRQVDAKASAILEAQLLMLEDETLIHEIESRIQGGINAEYAAYITGVEKASEFEKMDDDYLRARSADMRAVTRRIAHRLMGYAAPEMPKDPFILVADELTPEEMAHLDRSAVLGVVTRTGSASSHTSILAANYGIPCVFGVDFDRDAVSSAKYAALDAGTGEFILSPGEATQRRLRAKKQAEESALSSADHYSGPVKVYANIASPDDLRDVRENGASGIGLFRTEFLYMNRSTLPDEDEQFKVYQSVLEAMNGGEVVIRTMDIGADKQTACLPMEKEENPALGKRAIRICLDDTELFRTQLRALLRAAVYGNAFIMYPMISSEQELDEIHEQVRLAAAELEKRGEPYKIPPQGIMIETPAAAMLSDKLAKKADFFSIGTNDLTQYTIALDRQAKGLERFYNPRHEAVLRLMEKTVENAHRNNIWVGVCGEMSADPEIIPRLVRMGIDELSMSPFKVRRAKSVLSMLSDAETKKAPSSRSNDYEEIAAPADGLLIPMESIADEAFASGVMGTCVGVMPSSDEVYAPCGGTVTMIADTLHAVGIHSDGGNDVLVHVGINTVSLGGKGFDCRVSVGDHVTKGELILRADFDFIRSSGLDPTVIVVCEGGRTYPPEQGAAG